ncbi:MAG: PadR family transcriptional regulator [Bacteroidota bacterium]
MGRIQLGEFEELILLLVAILDGQAYGIAVMEELKRQNDRSVNISAIHATLRRLEAKGFVRSSWSEATKARGGRRKRLFIITQHGVHALQKIRDMSYRLWDQIPNLGTNLSFV